MIHCRNYKVCRTTRNLQFFPLGYNLGCSVVLVFGFLKIITLLVRVQKLYYTSKENERRLPVAVRD